MNKTSSKRAKKTKPARKKRKTIRNETSLENITGMPAKDSVIGEVTFKSPKGKVYRILKTNETDAYDNLEEEPE